MNRTGWQSWNTGGRDTTQGLSGEVLVKQVPRRPVGTSGRRSMLPAACAPDSCYTKASSDPHSGKRGHRVPACLRGQ